MDASTGLAASFLGSAEMRSLANPNGFSLVLAEPCPAAHAERLLRTMAGFPRRTVAPALLTAAQRRARWQRAKLMYRVMRGMTGILVRLALYGMAYRLVRVMRGAPFRRRRAIRGPISRNPVAAANANLPPTDGAARNGQRVRPLSGPNSGRAMLL